MLDGDEWVEGIWGLAGGDLRFVDMGWRWFGFDGLVN